MRHTSHLGGLSAIASWQSRYDPRSTGQYKNQNPPPLAPTIERRIKSLGMTTKDQSLVPALDALANWRQSLARELSSLTRFFTSNDLLSAPSADIAESLRQRLLADKLVVAFVAEFSRGKSELINAIFFADTGRRILPASPGRTTMCPVELAWDDKRRADAGPAADRHAPRRLVADRAARHARRLEARAARSVRPDALAAALSEVTHTARSRRTSRASWACGRTPIPRTTRRWTSKASSRCRPGATR
jgi:hypothetical protein